VIVSVDLEGGRVLVEDGGTRRELPLDSSEAFDVVSKAWVRAGWDAKYVYSFSWLGRPVIQLPDDLLRIQEVIYDVQPDVIVETGVAHGGSLIFYATLCKALERGRVVGIDIDIRPHNRQALDEHLLRPFITLVEGSSIDPAVTDEIAKSIRPDEKVLVLLDSNHTRAHVLAELRAYADMVTPGSYLVATDGIMADLVGAPRSEPDWGTNNPQGAVSDFLREREDFQLVEPAFPFNEGKVRTRVTYWPNCYLRRLF
jgi:cephalosporin hydroxylase